MSFMKGLNCYAVFWDDAGIEKFPNFNQTKMNFLVPVTPRLSQQGPASVSFVAVFGCRTLTPRSPAAPATLCFTALHILRNGRRPGTDQLHVPTSDVDRFFGVHRDI